MSLNIARRKLATTYLSAVRLFTIALSPTEYLKTVQRFMGFMLLQHRRLMQRMYLLVTDSDTICTSQFYARMEYSTVLIHVKAVKTPAVRSCVRHLHQIESGQCLVPKQDRLSVLETTISAIKFGC